MLDRVIDAPAQRGSTDLEEALAQAAWEELCSLSLVCIKSQALSSFFRSGCLQLI